MIFRNDNQVGAELERLEEDSQRENNWKRWGPYLSELQWGTVREDYSADGFSWDYFPHEHARSRAYRWGEDGLLGMCDLKFQVNWRSPLLIDLAQLVWQYAFENRRRVPALGWFRLRKR